MDFTSLFSNNFLDYLNTDALFPSTNNLNGDNSLFPLTNNSLDQLNANVSLPPADYLNGADASHVPNDVLDSYNHSLSSTNFPNVDHSLPSTNFQNSENSLPLTDHLNTDVSLPPTDYLYAADASLVPNDLLDSLDVDQSLSSTDFLNAENSLTPMDSLNADSSLPWTYNLSAGHLLPSTGHLNTQNSFPSTNLLNQSNSLDHAQETSITSLDLNVIDPVTQINSPELQLGYNFSFFTSNQDKRLSISTMPIISHNSTSFGEEPNTSDLRRHTITELMPSQLCQKINYANSTFSFNVDFQANSRTNIKSYLSEYDLVRRSLIEQNKISDTSIKYSWTDIGQIREWESFSLEEFSKINSLQHLLERDLPKSSLPTPVISCCTSDHNGEYFAAKINTALSQFQEHRYLKMQVHKDEKTNEEIFLSSCDGYASSDEKQDRIVGLRKHLNGWDLIWGKNAAKLKQELDYLESLAQLHYYLREYGCRYGYILTDDNLVVVRHGVEKTPNFGFLETKIFPLNPSRRPSLDENGEPSECLNPRMKKGLVQEGPALLALWYLHMLARDITIPGNASWDIDTDSYSDKSKHMFLTRDTDLLKILDADVRRAKRRKRWTTPWEIKTPRSVKRIHKKVCVKTTGESDSKNNGQ
ncbi:putative sialidase protein [Erysiphe neolycopersici]|uniref:Putative sialidase protein n=1 Tax=Erysiphe neolycopersici TaxID=212602 RepID=A0A420I7D3_9PEZI|nr:putative sialidase protein [Erysiphe neolycopersici]